MTKAKMSVVGFKFDPCSIFQAESTECRNASFEEVLRTISRHRGGEYPVHRFHDGFQLFGEYLSLRNTSFYIATKEINRISEAQIRDETAFARDLITKGATVCRLDPDESRQLSLRLTRLRLIESNSPLVTGSKFAPDFIERYRKFPQVWSNTQAAFLDFDSGIADMMGQYETRGKAYSFQDVSSTLSEEIIKLNQQLQKLVQSCELESDRVTKSLRSLEDNLTTPRR